MTDRASSALELLAICAAFGLVVLLVDPRGNFPLNDDWDFAKAAWGLAETGELRFTGYTAASVHLQAAWGALWTRIFGASYDVLRASTLALALATLLLLDRLLARLGASRAARLLGVGAMLAHPIWLWSAFTFMTHVPAIFMSLIAIGAFAEAIRRDAPAMSALGGAATVGSYFVRQTGVVNSIAALAMFLLFRERISKRWRVHAALAAAPVILFAVLFIATDWLGGSGGELRQHYEFLFEETFGAIGLLKVLVNYTIFNWIDAGLFFVPLAGAALVLLARSRTAARAVLASLALVFVARATYLVVIGLPMPFYSATLRSDVFAVNVFVNWGLGPLTLPDTWGGRFAYPHAIGFGWRVALTLIAAILGAAALSWCITRLRRQPAESEARGRVVAFLVLHLFVANCALMLSYLYTDRYGLDAHWPLAILFPLTIPMTRTVRGGAAALLLCLALFSTSAVAEYLEWNRARWAGIAWLEARGVPESARDAGVEPRMHARAKVGEPRRRGRPDPPSPYLVTFNPMPGYREIHRIEYARPFGRTRGRVLILEQEREHRERL